MPVDVLSPVSGQASPLEDSPDPIFSMGAVGWGVTIDPTRGRSTVVAPVDGTIEKIEPHVFSIAMERGAVMVQVGIGADRLEGKGYELLKQRGDTVKTGDPIVAWDPAEIEASGVTPHVIVVAISEDEFSLKRVKSRGAVNVGDVVFVIP